MGLCWVGVGFDGEVLKHIKPRLKARFGRAAFVLAILKAMTLEPKYHSVPWSYRLSVDSPSEEGVCGWALVANISRYAGPFRLTKKTRLGDRGLACLLFSQVGGWARALDQLIIAFKPLDQRAGTRQISEGILTLGNDTTPIQLDGDLIGEGPVVVEPGQVALRFKSGVPE